MQELAAGPVADARAPVSAVDDNAEAQRFAQLVSEREISDFQERLAYSLGPPHFAYPPECPVVWVKSGGLGTHAEGEMQCLAWRWLRGERQAGRCLSIQVPEVFKIFTITTIVSRFNPTTGSRFETKAERSYIIMELLDATVFTKCSQYPPADCYDLIAEGIQLLRRMPVPEGTTPGPYTKDPTQRPKMKHPLFKEDQAEMVYRDIDELQDHINRVIRAARRVKGSQPPTVHLENQLTFCYCDLNEENFMFKRDANGRLCLYIVDFEHASFLPISLLSITLFRKSPDWTTVPAMVARIGHTLPKTNVEGLQDAREVFWTSPWTVGLEGL